MGLELLGIPSPVSSEQEARMSVTSYADDLGSAVHYALETTHAIARRQLGKAADRYCPYCALLGDPEL
jgi:hypothetical protein